jgi:predicted  nucleic acid-binding Zn-ribbon protein
LKNLVKQLIELQEIDSRFENLQLQKGDLPMIIEESELDLHEKKDQLNEAEQKIKQGELDRRLFQQEIDASKVKLAKYEEQLYQVQTNKEYDAISLEIDSKKVEINEFENKILQSLEEEEELKGIQSDLSDNIKKIESQLAEYKKELNEILEHTISAETQLNHEREKIVRGIDPRFLKRYEKIRKAKNGLSVVAIKKGSCGGCYSSIPPQRTVQIRELDKLYTCEHCGRILVWSDNSE